MNKLLSALTLLVSVTWGFAQEMPVNVYFLGDAGEPMETGEPNLQFLRAQLANATANDVLIFLGDNLYPKGLPQREDPERHEMERRLNAQLDVIKDFPGQSFMIPGNHDWKKGKKQGWEQIKEMDDYVSAYLGDETVFLPNGGCPGPEEIIVSDKIVLIIFDSQYMLHPWEKPDEESSCEQKSTRDALLALEEMIEQNADKHVIVASHHPLYSHGPHGGYYTFRQHLFPLSDINRNLKIPLPVIGSIYPLYRQLIGSRQDITHPRYHVIRNTIVDFLETHPDLVYISGHEHSLQYLTHDSVHYVVSGAGTESSPVKLGKYSQFAHEGNGFARLIYSPSDSVRLTFWDGNSQDNLYDQLLYHRKVVPGIDEVSNFNFADSTVIRPISGEYEAGEFQKKVLGKNYRDLWGVRVEMQVFNIGNEHGGLKIKKLGGGNQTRSLRLEAKNGRQYVLRSLNKYTDKLLPDALQKTLAADVLQDEISAANPYGAFAIPALADAANVLHTNPKLMFVPDDPRFGDYQEIFAGQVVLYEERPNDEAAKEDFFGLAETIIGTPDLLEELYDDNQNRVDQRAALRARLFDNVIGDWDRHDDQWRWAGVDYGKGWEYQPIPRDRDQAFFKADGFVSWIAARKWALPNMEGFHETISYPEGFNTSGRFFDRTFLTELGWRDWQEEIAKMQQALSDDAIDQAFAEWPDTVKALNQKQTIEILKSRLAHLEESSREWYLFLAKEVEIVGSNKHEYFLVERLSDEETRVRVYRKKKDEDVKELLFDRVFLTAETKEIRLYGLEGHDKFEVKGSVNKGIKVRIIGGEDEDEIIDKSSVAGLGHKTEVYDLAINTTLESGDETLNKLSNNIDVNRYDRKGFKYDKLMPLASFAFNQDDGIFLGAGFLYTKQGWRKEPFAQQHKFTANAAFETGAINLKYENQFTDAVGKWDWGNDLVLQRPYGVANYFGMGNDSYFDYKGENITVFDDGEESDDYIDYYRVRYEHLFWHSYLKANLGAKGLLRLGPVFEGYEIEQKQNTYLADGDQDLDRIYQKFMYLGYKTQIAVDARNHAQLPSSGIYAQASFGDYYGLTDAAHHYANLDADFRFYITRELPMKVTLASRVGAEYVSGNYEFFNGAIIGRETIRGYRRTRFVGNTSFYHNLDLRMRLFSFRTYLFPGSAGLLGFHDVGRVWLSGENSNDWHRSGGFGVWLAPLNQWVLCFQMSFSEEENLPSVKMGFQF